MNLSPKVRIPREHRERQGERQGESASNTTSATTDATIHSRTKCSFTDFTENIQLKLKQ